ncbi:MAG: quinate 5-dehydrogenase [Coriobacteriia bacterium]|nr:quinate 5-dehydrogenase [Coriobacteriia bacterium]
MGSIKAPVDMAATPDLQPVAPQKSVVSISLGSSARDHQAEIQLGNQYFSVHREGTDGDSDVLKRRLVELDADPTVAAIGLGGTDLFLNAADRTYWLRETKSLAKIVRNKALVDGSGLKGAVEADTVRHLRDDLGIDLLEKRVLITSAVDRWGLGMAFCDAGVDTDFADLFYILGLRKIIRDRKTLTRVVRMAAPLAVQLPFAWLYPSGSDHTSEPKLHPWTDKLYEDYDIIAGDYKYIAKYMPPNLKDTWVITNTTTEEDVEFLRSRGVSKLITTTPRLEGRTFGTNVMEALLVAAAGESHPLSPQGYLDLLAKYDLRPSVQEL